MQSDSRMQEYSNSNHQPYHGNGEALFCNPFGMSFSKFHILQFETHILSERSCELQRLVLEFGQVTCHLEYLNSILTAMFEAWDDLLFNLDSQLASYAQVRVGLCLWLAFSVCS